MSYVRRGRAISSQAVTLSHSTKLRGDGAVVDPASKLARRRAAEKFVLASPLVCSTCPNKTTLVLAPACHNARARAAPSPPLLPGPHSTSAFLAERSCEKWRAMELKAAFAAASINSSDGVSNCSTVRRSISRICADEITGCTLG